MTKTAILVIAAQNKPVYEHYIKNYWSDFIDYTNRYTSQIDVYLLFQKHEDISPYAHMINNIIIDQNTDFNGFFKSNEGHKAVPGILSKTIYAFEQLVEKYDLFFRTNLSSMIHLPNFERLIESKVRIIYSGYGVWKDALRRDLVVKGKVGPGKSIKMIEELDSFPGNTFISGSAFFLNKTEIYKLLKNKHRIRYDLVDDVSIGLMMSESEYLPRFTLRILKTEPLDQMLEKIAKDDYCHIRLQHFPVEIAIKLWDEVKKNKFWIDY